MHAHLLYAHELWIPNAPQAWLRRKKMLSSTLRSWKTLFQRNRYICIGGKGTSSIALTNLLESASVRKNWLLQYHPETKKRRSKTASTSMGYNVWWLVLFKNGNSYSNQSTLLCVQSSTAHLYGKVEGMWAVFCMLSPHTNHLCRVNLRKFHQLYGW